jgi:6-phosphofructokinase
MVIAQSGGPSMVINQSLVGAVLAARAAKGIGKILGARHGIAGILAGDYIDLRKPTAAKLEAIAATPGSALGSVRKKPTPEKRPKRRKATNCRSWTPQALLTRRTKSPPHRRRRAEGGKPSENQTDRERRSHRSRSRLG